MSGIGIVIAKLRATPEVIAVTTDGRIYPIVAPEKTAMPFITIELSSEADQQMLGGAGGYYSTRVTVSTLATTATQANEMGELVKKALGDVTKATIAGAKDVDIVKQGTDFSDYADDRSVYRRAMDFYVQWR